MKSIGVTVSKRGYIVLPATLRKELDIKAGTKVILTRDEDRIILQPIASFTDKLSGLTQNSFGETPDDVNRFIDREREKR